MTLRNAILTSISAILLIVSTNLLAKLDPRFIKYQGTVLIEGVTLIDGTGQPAKKHQDILIQDGKISKIGSKITAPDDGVVIKGQGKTVIPGLVMMHEHMFYPTGRRNYTEMLYSFPRLYLAGGATTVRTGGTMNPYGDMNLRDAIAEGKTIGPDMDVTAAYLNGPGLPIYKVKALQGPQDAKRMVNYWADEGVTSYKAYMHIRNDELKKVIEIAHGRGHKVTGHLCSITYREAAELGIDNLEHGFFAATDFVKDKKRNECPRGGVQSLVDLDIDSKEVTDLIEFLVAKKVALTSTLTIFETYAKGRPKAYPKALDMLIPQVRAQYESRWQKIHDGNSQDWAIVFNKMMELEKRFVEAGGTLLVGTDPTGYGGVIAGFANKRAIELLVEAGFTIEQAVQFSTFNGARFMGRKDIGLIKAGKRADLLLIEGDLSSSTEAIRNIPVVFKAGIGYDSEKIIEQSKGIVGLH